MSITLYSILKGDKNKHIPSQILINDKLITNSKNIYDCFNSFYKSWYKSIQRHSELNKPIKLCNFFTSFSFLYSN